MAADAANTESLTEVPAQAVAALPAPDTLQPATLADTLATLQERGADGFDLLRFGLIAALVRRAGGQRPARAQRTLARAQRLLSEYLEALRRALEDAAGLLAAEPDLQLQVAALLGRYDLAGLRRLQARRARERVPPGPLVELVDHLQSRGLGAMAEEGGGEDFSDSLQAQVEEILTTYAVAPDTRGELRSARRYRQAVQRSGAERLVAESLAQTPEEPGPLNPQKLGTQAMGAMQSLSPACSARYVAHLNTLFFLESLQRE